jgi:Ca2+-dependent lipid-binding protein
MDIDYLVVGLLLLSNTFYANGAVTGPLKVYVKSASDLPDKDGWMNKSDPYVKVVACKSDGTVTLPQSTHHVSGTHNPQFNDFLRFGEGTWSHFYIQAWDKDDNADDALTGSIRVDIVAGNAGTTLSTATSGPRITYVYYLSELIPH